jgi:ATP-binding protein involved in chromosome partitioning
MITEQQILDTLQHVMDPELGKNIVELGMVRDIKIAKGGKVSFTLKLTIKGCPMQTRMAEDARIALQTLPDVTEVKVNFGEMSDEERQAVREKMGGGPLPKLNEFNKVKQIVAVMSGKGGVGKSSVTALLAAALQRKGLKTGILDADLTGPSIPRLFGLPSGGLRGSEQGILPGISSSGIKIMSINLVLPEEDVPVVWRGPLIGRTINQFWTDTLWGSLDYLLVDLPPGTSDAALTVMQSIPLDGIILVTTPQQLAGMVVRKAIHMAEQLKIPVVGLVENMAYYPCPDSGNLHYIFGPSHVEELAAVLDHVKWGRLPIDPRLATLGDAGQIESAEMPDMDALVQQLVEVVEKIGC